MIPVDSAMLLYTLTHFITLEWNATSDKNTVLSARNKQGSSQTEATYCNRNSFFVSSVSNLKLTLEKRGLPSGIEPETPRTPKPCPY